MKNQSLKDLEINIAYLKSHCPTLGFVTSYNSQAYPSCFGRDECFYGCEVFIPMDVQVHVLSNKSVGNLAWRVLKKLETFRSDHIDKLISELKFIAEKPDEHNNES